MTENTAFFEKDFTELLFPYIFVPSQAGSLMQNFIPLTRESCIMSESKTHRPMTQDDIFARYFYLAKVQGTLSGEENKQLSVLDKKLKDFIRVTIYQNPSFLKLKSHDPNPEAFLEDSLGEIQVGLLEALSEGVIKVSTKALIRSVVHSYFYKIGVNSTYQKEVNNFLRAFNEAVEELFVINKTWVRLQKNQICSHLEKQYIPVNPEAQEILVNDELGVIFGVKPIKLTFKSISKLLTKVVNNNLGPVDLRLVKDQLLRNWQGGDVISVDPTNDPDDEDSGSNANIFNMVPAKQDVPLGCLREIRYWVRDHIRNTLSTISVAEKTQEKINFYKAFFYFFFGHQFGPNLLAESFTNLSTTVDLPLSSYSAQNFNYHFKHRYSVEFVMKLQSFAEELSIKYAVIELGDLIEHIIIEEISIFLTTNSEYQQFAKSVPAGSTIQLPVAEKEKQPGSSEDGGFYV